MFWIHFISFKKLLQIVIQTPFIIATLRRCSNSIENRKKKPGRELVMFLTIANVSLWIYYTSSVKNADTKGFFFYYTLSLIWGLQNLLGSQLTFLEQFFKLIQIRLGLVFVCSEFWENRKLKMQPLCNWQNLLKTGTLLKTVHKEKNWG